MIKSDQIEIQLGPTLGQLIVNRFPTTEKLINDPVHGHYHIPKYCCEIIDTEQFQRLRNLKQLGCCYYCFPGASHNRFEHCLGVSYLAEKFLRRIRKNQPELNITDRDIQCVRVAGLCHDIGHGPFSHCFEHWVRKYLPTFRHEQMSVKIVEYIIQQNNLAYSEAEIKLIQDLIIGNSNEYKEKRFLFDIVANSRNSIDVDKFDYIARDCLNLGIKYGWDFTRIMKFCRVIDDEVCFNEKETYSIYELFRNRYSLHKQVYTHKVVTAIELMLEDILTLANPHLKIIESILDPKYYCTLTDNILEIIENSTVPELQEAKNLVLRIKRRQLYKCVANILITDSNSFLLELTSNDLIQWIPSLKAEEIVIKPLRLNYAMSDNFNPVDHVKFFNNLNPNVSYNITRDKISALVPCQFSECYLRIYLKKPENTDAIETFLNTFLVA